MSICAFLQSGRRAVYSTLMLVMALMGTATWDASAAEIQPIANVRSDMEPRVRACTACHGDKGRATPEGYFPRIAGKPARYLANQLLNFKEGRRQYAAMNGLIEHLSDEYLTEIAAYFAALDVPYPAPPAPSEPPAVLERGRLLVHQGDTARRIPACISCHGAAMTGVQPATPGLLGLPRDYLNGQLGAWATGQRRAQAPDCMAHVAKLLSAADVSAVSAWLSAQPVPARGKALERLPQPPPLRCGSLDGAL